MKRPGEDDFYVGYAPSAPAELARVVRKRVAMVAVVAAAVIAALAAAQQHFAPATFEYGVERSVVGVVQERPYPAVRVPNTSGPDTAGWVTYLLSSAGKHGAGPDVSGRDGKWARLDGSLAHRGNDALLEVARIAPAAAPAGRTAIQPAQEELGTETLIGEVVDGKCYLGVMNPGAGITHRGCATLCLRGGIPPLFEVRTGAGETRTLVLVDDQGRPLTDRLAGWIGSPVQIRGRLTREGDLVFLWADPATYERAER